LDKNFQGTFLGLVFSKACQYGYIEGKS
jgi:hypothetical protein